MIRRRIYKCEHPETDAFYTWDKLLSHNADVSIAQSIRDLGKSHGMLRVSVKKAASQGYNSVISRWEIGELEHVDKDMFDASELKTKDNPEGLWVKGSVSQSTWYYERVDNGAQVWFMSTKASNKNKGTDIKNLRWWFYDEFIPEQYDTQTRKIQEFDRFASMYWTLVRNNKHMRVVLACNTITWFNGYYDAWNIKPFPAGHIVKQIISINVDGIKRDMVIAVENVKPTRAMLERIAKHEAIKGRRYSAEYWNSVTGDNTAFLKQCPDMTAPLFNAQWLFMKRIYSFRTHGGLFYWCECAKRDVPTYTTSKTDVGVGVVRDRSLGKTFDVLYDTGKLRFEDGNVEQAVLSMIWASRQNQI